MTRALANMQIVISRLLRSLRITKGPTRWLNGEPHRQRDNLLNRPDGHKRACTSQALHACSCQASAEHLQQCAEFLLSRPDFNPPRFARHDVRLTARAAERRGRVPWEVLFVKRRAWRIATMRFVSTALLIWLSAAAAMAASCRRSARSIRARASLPRVPCVLSALRDTQRWPLPVSRFRPRAPRA